METCVLLPSEFSLVLSIEESQQDSDLEEEETVSRGHPYDMKVRLWANQAIPVGRTFSPAEGSVRLDCLEVYSLLDDNDIRHSMGCYDEIREVECRQVRHCNWVRFVRVARRMSKHVNLVASRVRASPTRTQRFQPQQGLLYRVLRPVLPNTELVVFYRDERAVLTSTPRLTTDFGRRLLQRTLQDSPLDLSQGLLSPSTSSLSSSSCTTSSSSSSVNTSSATFRSLGSTSLTSSSSGSPSTSALEANNENIQPPRARKEDKKIRRQKCLLECDFCGKAFDRPSLLRRHMRTHTGEKPHVCDVCGKAFSTSSSLNTHRRIHSGEKPHQCPVCGKRFTASSNLYYHRMTHSKEKPHKCPVCSKSFPTPGDLKSHAYVHSGSWPYRCHLCDRGFSKHTNLKNHLFLHTGDRPHTCDVCHKTFALTCNLRAHMKTHQEGCAHVQCQQCQAEFPVSSRLVVNGICQQCTHQPSTPLLHQPDFSIRRLVST